MTLPEKKAHLCRLSNLDVAQLVHTRIVFEGFVAVRAFYKRQNGCSARRSYRSTCHSTRWCVYRIVLLLFRLGLETARDCTLLFAASRTSFFVGLSYDHQPNLSRSASEEVTRRSRVLVGGPFARMLWVKKAPQHIGVPSVHKF